MNRLILSALICTLALLPLSGCGGGGGGGGGPITKAVTKVYLFGNMTSTVQNVYFGNISSSVRVTSVDSSLNVPSGVQVNYSSAVGATTGNCILRKGVFISSGPIIPNLTESNFSNSRFDIDPLSRKLSIKIFNAGFVKLKASETKNAGKGEEIATIIFNLATPGVKPVTNFDEIIDRSPTVGLSDNLLNGNTPDLRNPRITFVTTYQ
jgi:hypothetical protein